MVTYARVGPPGRRLLGGLQRPADAFAHLGPNWFASVMGTGIIANAAAGLPVHVPGLLLAARVVWLLAAAMLIVLTVATVIHWTRHRQTARSHISNPVLGHFYGAPPMALLTVGAGAVLVGYQVIGRRAAIDLDWILWITGTVAGLATALIVPHAMFTRRQYRRRAAFGGWLMPVVPPMVSASTGALLVPHLASHRAQTAMVLACYAMFGLSLLASLVIITLIWERLTQHDAGPANLVPTLWIVLGPIGQSATAVGLLANVSQHVWGSPFTGVTAGLALLYGVGAWGFAALWSVLAAAITVRTAREHLPFSLTWWSFTFPVGTCVTAASSLASRTGLDPLRYMAGALFAFLVTAWATVALRTLDGLLSGRLLLPGNGATSQSSKETSHPPRFAQPRVT